MAYKSTVLIVDDEPSARDTLEALLYREGYDLAFASDGPEALEKAASLTPDVILLDVMMPGMDGFEVCRRLRADPLLAESPVIMVTALDDRDSRLRGIEAGADDFVSKPFDRVELRARVRTTTRLNRYRRLLTERAKFKWVVEQADDGYLMVNDDDEILYANPQARLYLDIPPSAPEQTSGDRDAPISETFLALAGKRYRCQPQENWAAGPAPSTVAAQTPRYLVRPESPTAGAFWLQVDLIEISPRTEEGRLVRLRDVTSSVLNQVNVWTFQGLVNHKLRTPLGILTGFLDVLADDLAPLLDAEAIPVLDAARDGALRLQDKILSILAYLDAPVMVSANVDGCSAGEIPEIIAEINGGLEIEALDVFYASQELNDDARVSISRQAVEMILWELLENAKKFHPQGTPTVTISVSDVAGGIHIQVGDDGLTLSPDQLAKIWDPYYQAERRFSGQVPGMGLGLPTVAALAWGAGGTCRARNRDEGPGIVIELVLPTEGE